MVTRAPSPASRRSTLSITAPSCQEWLPPSLTAPPATPLIPAWCSPLPRPTPSRCSASCLKTIIARTSSQCQNFELSHHGELSCAGHRPGCRQTRILAANAGAGAETGLGRTEPHTAASQRTAELISNFSTEIIPDGFLTASNASQFQHQDCPGISQSPASLFFPHPCVITKKRKEHKRSQKQVLKPEYKKKSCQRTTLAKFNWRFSSSSPFFCFV